MLLDKADKSVLGTAAKGVFTKEPTAKVSHGRKVCHGST
jgi:hypothetical protein